MNAAHRPLRRPAGALRRERVDALVDSAWAHGLTLLVAPAGSGKTTALEHFAQRWPAVAWCSAEELELAPDGCVAEIARQLGDVIGMTLDGSSPAALDASLFEWPAPRVALVLDDLHAIASTYAESELGRLIDERPTKLAIIAGTRSFPEFDLSRLQLAGELLVGTADDLRFRMSEADRLLREQAGVSLGPLDVATLVNRLEGWAAGLQLFRLAARGRPLKVREQLINDPSGTRLGRDYLARNVLSGLPPDVLSFLMDTAALPTLTPELCDAITQRDDAAQMLEFLERNQLFTIPVDGGRVYRYHEVLRGYLDARLIEREGNEGALAHHRRVGSLLEARAMIGDALQAYSRAGAWDAVSRLVLDGVQHPDVGDAWLELVPNTTVESDPNLQLARARQRVRSGRFAGGLRDYERAAASAILPLSSVCVEERAIVAAWLDATLPAPTGWTAPIHQVAHAVHTHRFASAAQDAPELVLAEALDALVDLDLGTAMARLDAVLCGPATDRRTAVAAHFALVAARGLRPVATLLAGDVAGDGRVAPAGGGDADRPVGVLDPDDIEAVIDHAESVHAGWFARLAHALRALTASADGCRDARLVAAACTHHGDRWGAAIAVLLNAMGTLLRGEHLPESAETANTMFRELGAPRLAALATRVHDAMAPDDTGSRPAALGVAELAPVAVRCFGSLELIVDGRRVDVSGLRPRALSALRLLALHAGQPVHRETIMEALWRDVRPEAALRGLHVALSSVRRTLPVRAEMRIVRHGEAYELAVDPSTFFDVGAFRDAAGGARAGHRDGNLRAALDAALQAVAIYRDDLLVDEGPADWLIRHRDALRLDLVGAARIAGETALALDSPHEAIPAIERGLRADGYADPLWRLLIAAHERAGHRAAATRAQALFAKAMADLGL